MEKKDLKFRVWNGSEMEHNIMVGKFGIFYVNPSNNGIDKNDTASLSPFNTKYPDDIPLMRFTGLTDKNGNDIYEGDICKDTDGRKLEVGWSNKFASFVLKSERWAFKHWFGESCDPEEVEIIGNVYENTANYQTALPKREGNF